MGDKESDEYSGEYWEAKLVEIKIDEAVAVEREACAKIAETLFPPNGAPLSVGQDIALQIRDR